MQRGWRQKITKNDMYRLLARWLNRGRLAGSGFVPLPAYIKGILARFPLAKQIAIYARLVENTDLSFVAPDELGCAESVTRLINYLEPTLGLPVVTGTWTLDQALKRNTHFFPIQKMFVRDGCIIIAVTGEGIGNGHVGILVGDRVYSNNSNTGRWDKHFTHDGFRNYFIKRGFPIKYYLPVKNR